MIDESDAATVGAMSWHGSGTGYAAHHSRARGRHYMHRFLMAPPRGMYVDHINGNTLDNRRDNLRVATPVQNSQNMHQPNRRKTSRFKGVSLVKKNGKWKAAIRYGGRCYHLGWFDAEEDAARTYDAKAREQFGPFANCNFPVAS